MMGRDNRILVVFENRAGEEVLAKRSLSGILLGMFAILGLVFIFLVISNFAEAGDYGVAIQYNTPSNGIANVTPVTDYVYTLDIINTGTSNPGEDINFTVELDAASVAAGWTVTPSGTTIIPNVQMGPANKTTETVTVRAPSDAKFQDTAIINVTVDVIGHTWDVGGLDSLQLRANVLQVFDVKMTTIADTKTGDPGEDISFELKISNRGNGDDTFAFSAEGTELGEWSVPDVTLVQDEFIFVYYNVSINPNHDTSDILITLNVSSLEDISGLTYDILDITIHVNPRYEVRLGVQGPIQKEVAGGQSVIFNLTIQNRGTANDTYDIEPKGTTGFWATPETLTVTLAPDELIIVEIRVSPPEGIPVGIHNITINVTSQIDASATDEYTFYADVLPSYDVYLYLFPQVFEGYPGDTIYIDIGIKNYGNADDKFSINISGLPPGWDWSPPGVYGPIPPGVTRVYTIWIHIPPGTSSGFYEFYITARSEGDQLKEMTIQGWVYVYQIYGVQLPSSVAGKNVDVGDVVIYIIDVKNTGTGDDDIEIRLTGDVEFWTWLYYSPTENGTTIHISPPAGGTFSVYLYVAPPLDYWDTGNETIELTIEAESLDDPDIYPASDTVIVTSTVNPVYGVNIIEGSIYTTGDPGELKQFTFFIENTGTTTDGYNIIVESISTETGGDSSIWITAISFNPTSISNLNSGTISSPITMNVDIPFPSDLSLIPPGY
ncbi:MAG: hypothetical protein JSV09_14715, partial [Thermoplasmata archaeon]